MKLKYNCIWVIFHLTVFLAVSLFVLPSLMEAVSAIWQTALIGRSAQQVNALSDAERQQAMADAAAYNVRLAKKQAEEPFVYQGLSGEGTEYDALLSEGEDGIMAYLEIPDIDVYLPVCHGTESSRLKYEAGHMYGTSLPVGGDSVHSVIAAHTGLPEAALFTDLIRVEKGDEFYIHVLGEVHCYTVEKILTVPQGTESPYLGIEEGRDLVTLYTCTPYGINDHRLLVKGVRTLPDRSGPEASEGLLLKRKNLKAAALAGGLGALPLLSLLVGCLDLNRRIDRRRAACRKKTSQKKHGHPLPYAEGSVPDGEKNSQKALDKPGKVSTGAGKTAVQEAKG